MDKEIKTYVQPAKSQKRDPDYFLAILILAGIYLILCLGAYLIHIAPETAWILRPLYLIGALILQIVVFILREISIIVLAGIAAIPLIFLVWITSPKRCRDYRGLIIFFLVVTYFVLGDLAGYILTYKTASTFSKQTNTYETIRKRDAILSRNGFIGLGKWSISGNGSNTSGMWYIWLIKPQEMPPDHYYDYTMR